MTAGLLPYPAYKPSGVPWLGDVPQHWEVRRFSTIAKGFNNGTTANQMVSGESTHLVSRIETISTGFVDYSRVGYLGRISKLQSYHLRKDDFLISHINSFARVGNSARYRGEHPLIHGMNLIRVIPLQSVIPAYLEYVLKTDVFLSSMQRVCKPAINQVSVTTTAIKVIKLPLPPLAEQQGIVGYLDHVDGRIRRYVAAKEKLVGLLEEERQAVVNRAVTRGLAPNVRLKPSGVEWLGDVPEHWEVRRLKTLARIRYGLGQPPEESAEGLPLIRATNVERGKIVEKGLIHVDPSSVPVGRNALLKAKEIIIVRSGAYTADSAIVPDGYEGAVAGYDMVLTMKEPQPEFVAMVLLSTYLRDEQLIPLSTRSAQPHLNAEELGSATLLLPQLSEQRAIVEYLDKTTANIDTAIARARQQIELLQEYRIRLIADVVTGKLDVRVAAARLPDEDSGGNPTGDCDILSESIGPASCDTNELAGETAMGREAAA